MITACICLRCWPSAATIESIKTAYAELESIKTANARTAPQRNYGRQSGRKFSAEKGLDGHMRNWNNMKNKFYVVRDKEIVSRFFPPVGKNVQFLFMDSERLAGSARIVGNVTDENMLKMLETAEGLRSLVYGMGISVKMTEGKSSEVDFVFRMSYGQDSGGRGTELRISVPTDGTEKMVCLADFQWSEKDERPGMMGFEFPVEGDLARATVKFYLQDGSEAPEEIEEGTADLESAAYQEMLRKSLLQTGNPARLQKALARARRGEDVTVAFIGGSITGGAGAIPGNTGCYAFKTFQRFCRLAGKGTEENIHYIKAGVGGTPSELGMIRYERDVLRDGSVEPDVVVVEFAVNDADDETGGVCYDSLVRKILSAENRPAVILLFAVFDDDWNLQERLSPVGKAYDLPMVSVKDAVVEQFCLGPAQGKVLSRNQFFADCYHPTNLGHTVMADCIDWMLQAIDRLPAREDTLCLDEIAPPLGGEFEKVRLFDRKEPEQGIQVDCGSFCHRDEDLQFVDFDSDVTWTKLFPWNWMHRAGAEDGGAAFVMEITCSALVLIYKDTASADAGRAEVRVDGEKVLTADPHANNWTHCHPLICFRGRECRQYHVEITMEPGSEEKEFTILGFGYVR